MAIEPIRTGRFNSGYHLSGEPGEFVLRVAPPDDAGFLFYERRMMRQEPEVHQLVREETHVPVAEIIAIKSAPLSWGVIRITYKGGSLRLINQITGLYELIGAVKAANPLVEIKGC
jgi:hypothetical protein